MSAMQNQLKILEQHFNGKKDNQGNPVYEIRALGSEGVVDFSLPEESLRHNDDFYSSGKTVNGQRPYIITIKEHEAVKIIPCNTF
jgi:hypothetical protein